MLWIKGLIAALVIMGATTFAKKIGDTWLAAVLVTLPYTTILFFVFTYLDPGKVEGKFDQLAMQTFWATLATSTFALGVALALKNNLSFPQAVVAGLVLLLIAQFALRLALTSGLI